MITKETNYLIYLLAKQDYSRKQLFDKLVNRENISLIDINNLLDTFEKKGYLSDTRFAKQFISSSIAKYRGRKRIFQEAVYKKGLSQELINNIFEEMDINWFQLCNECMQKKYRDLQEIDFKQKNKIKNYLAYNGFSYHEIISTLENL